TKCWRTFRSAWQVRCPRTPCCRGWPRPRRLGWARPAHGYACMCLGGADRAVAWPPEMVDASFDRTVPVHHQGMLVGEIALSKPPGEPFTPAERRLLADLAAQAGAALNGVRL